MGLRIASVVIIQRSKNKIRSRELFYNYAQKHAYFRNLFQTSREKSSNYCLNNVNPILEISVFPKFKHNAHQQSDLKWFGNSIGGFI